MWNERKVPQHLKDAGIIHIHNRKGNCHSCGNRRNVSLLIVHGWYDLSPCPTSQFNALSRVSSLNVRIVSVQNVELLIQYLPQHAGSVGEKRQEQHVDINYVWLFLTWPVPLMQSARMACDIAEIWQSQQVHHTWPAVPRRRVGESIGWRGKVRSPPSDEWLQPRLRLSPKTVQYDLFCCADRCLPWPPWRHTHQIRYWRKAIQSQLPAVCYKGDGDCQQVRFADDWALNAYTKQTIQHEMDCLFRACDNFGLTINTEKETPRRWCINLRLVSPIRTLW